MPNIELLGILLVAFLVIWLFVKIARLAIRVVLLLLGIVLVAGALYYVFMR